MINQFIVKAVPGKNQLIVILDGIFMKSEVELATFLISEECKKLVTGFEVHIDLKNFKSAVNGKILNSINFRSIIKRSGGGAFRNKGLDYALQQFEQNAVGNYSYENEWLFQ